MAWRVLLEGGPLDGKQAAFERENLPHGDAQTDWPEAFDYGQPPGRYVFDRQPLGRYVLDRQEPVPFAMGDHPNLLLTAHYRWEAA